MLWLLLREEISNVAPKKRSRHIYSFPFFVSFWDLRLGWGSSGNLATRDSGKVGALYQDHQRQILLQLNLNKWCISLCKDFFCSLNPVAGSFPTQWTRRRPFPWQLWSQASGRREEVKLEMSQNKSCWTLMILVRGGNGLDSYLATLFCVMLGIFVNNEILVLQMMASPEVSLQMIASGAKVFQTPRISSSQSGLIILPQSW